MNTTAQSQAPLITQAPDAALVARILLRQVENVVTCGYVDGNISMYRKGLSYRYFVY
jgi:hypothetical protein